MSIDYFALPRTTRPADWFERILPNLGLQLPQATLRHRVVLHITGVGGGSWSLGLTAGQLSVERGVVGPVAVQYTTSVAHFREAMFGAMRDRGVEVLQKLGLPLVLPSLRGLVLAQAQVDAVAQLSGTLTFALRDRRMDDTYTFTLTLGGGAPTAGPQATIAIDLDDLAALAAAKVPPLKIISSGKLRVMGDLDLPMRALTALTGRAV